jgi:hypothetical protein
MFRNNTGRGERERKKRGELMRDFDRRLLPIVFSLLGRNLHTEVTKVRRIRFGLGTPFHSRLFPCAVCDLCVSPPLTGIFTQRSQRSQRSNLNWAPFRSVVVRSCDLCDLCVSSPFNRNFHTEVAKVTKIRFGLGNPLAP